MRSWQRSITWTALLRCRRKFLLVVTDGRDNASQATFQEVLHKLQSKNGPVLYTIALEQNERRDDSESPIPAYSLGTNRRHGVLSLSSLDEVQSIASSIARRHPESIRNRLPLFEFARAGSLPLDSGPGAGRIRSTARGNPHRLLQRNRATPVETAIQSKPAEFSSRKL
jgi:hypothetical protein